MCSIKIKIKKQHILTSNWHLILVFSVFGVLSRRGQIEGKVWGNGGRVNIFSRLAIARHDTPTLET